MHIRRWASLALAGGVAAALTVVPTAAQGATGAPVTVTVGDGAAINGVGFEGMRFNAPQGMSVHKGDVLTFEFHGFHTATLLPADVNAQDWEAEHMSPTGDYALVQPDEDTTSPPTFKFNNNDVFPSDPTCGTTPDAPCDYKGTDVVNSGLPVAAPTFSVTVDANPGQSFWVICLLHAMMQLHINVVPDNEPTTTQAAIDSYAKSTIAGDREEAAALIPKLEVQTKHTTAGGHVVWDAYAGFDGDGWGLDGMFPHKLKIQKGDWVRWHFGGLQGNIHTVTFPKSAAVDLADNDFAGTNVKCEADPTDTPPDAPPPAFCSSGPQNIELEIRGTGVLRLGTHKYDGTGFHSSGLEGQDAPSTAPWSLKFTKRSAKHHPFTYACAVHGAMMSGKVVVK